MVRSDRRARTNPGRQPVLASDAFGAHGATGLCLVIDLVVWGGETSLRTGGTVPVLVVPGLLVIAYLLMLLCSARSFIPWIAMWTLGILAGLLMPTYLPFAGLGTAVFRLARNRSKRVFVVIVCLTAIPFALNTANSVQVLADGRLWAYPLGAIFWAVILAIPAVTGRMSRVTQLHAREVERERRAAAELRLRAERLRLARELHDIVSHSVSAMTLQAAGARAVVNDHDPRVLGALTAVENTGVQAMRELHRMLGLLRSVDTEVSGGIVLSRQASIDDIDDLLATARSCDVDVELIVSGIPGALDPSIDHAAYRMVQECLSNVIKHAGRSATARVQLSWEPQALKITIRSTPGIADSESRVELSTGLGLRGLQERVALVGGRFESGPSSDGAYIARAELPWVAPVSASDG